MTQKPKAANSLENLEDPVSLWKQEISSCKNRDNPTVNGIHLKLFLSYSYSSITCCGVYQYWLVAVHHYSMGLVAKDVSENQEVKLFIFVFIGYLEPTW